MKKLLIISTCFLFFSTISISLLAQETEEFNTKKTEVNIAVANIFAKNNYLPSYYYFDGDYYMYAYTDYYRQPELVVGLKFHGNKGAFRLGTNLKYSNVTYEEQNGSADKYTYRNFGTTLSLGYEWHSTFNRVNIFYGFDVATSYSGYFMEQEYSSSYPYEQRVEETKTNEFTIGVNPLVGVNFFITPNLSVGTEMKFIAEYVSGKSKNSSNSSNSVDQESNSSGFRTRFGPLGFLSINLHF